jgi:hypothetical protein
MVSSLSAATPHIGFLIYYKHPSFAQKVSPFRGNFCFPLTGLSPSTQTPPIQTDGGIHRKNASTRQKKNDQPIGWSFWVWNERT